MNNVLSVLSVVSVLSLNKCLGEGSRQGQRSRQRQRCLDEGLGQRSGPVRVVNIAKSLLECQRSGHIEDFLFNSYTNHSHFSLIPITVTVTNTELQWINNVLVLPVTFFTVGHVAVLRVVIITNNVFTVSPSLILVLPAAVIPGLCSHFSHYSSYSCFSSYSRYSG